MSLTLAGATALSAGIGALGSLFGGYQQGQYNAEEAQKNRDFQEKMYNKQVQDNINFWNLQNEYNLPSAQLQRLRDANLNPMLMYGAGGNVQNVANGAPESAQAPSGAQASKSFYNPIELANLALLQAEVENKKADTQVKETEARKLGHEALSVALQNEITEATKSATIALADKNVKKADQEIEWLATQDYCLTNMTAASIDNIQQVIDYRQKEFQLSSERLAWDAWYMMENIALGKQHVGVELKKLAVDIYKSRTERMRVVGELNVFQEQVKKIHEDTNLTMAEKEKAYNESYNVFLKNTMLENLGTDNLGGAAGLMLLLTGSMSGRIRYDD